MNLLLDREQHKYYLMNLMPLRFGNGTIFRLKAEIELDEEETSLLKKYNLASTVLIESNVWLDLKQAFKASSVLGLLVAMPILVLGDNATALKFFATIAVGFGLLYFSMLREQLKVKDLLNGGCTFRCGSVVALIQKEAYVENVSAYLRQVLESAKNWHDREAITIKPLDKEKAKFAVLMGLHQA